MENLHTDGLENVYTGLGRSGVDKRMNTAHYGPGTMSQAEADAIYRGDGLGRRIVDVPAEDCFRAGWEVKTDDAEADAAVMDLLDGLGANSAMAEAQALARLYGGAIVWIGVDGQDQGQPMDLASVRKIDWLAVYDRWDLTVLERYGDAPGDPANRYGQAKRYQFFGDSNVGQVLHESRCLVFEGLTTTRRQKRDNDTWADSALLPVLQALRDVGAAYEGTLGAMGEGSLLWIKLANLATMLAQDKDGKVMKHLDNLALYRSSMKFIPLDADKEDMGRVSSGSGEMSSGLQEAALYLSAVTGIPATLLWGRSPAGMSATGTSDLENYYTGIARWQEKHVRPLWNKLLEVVYSAKEGPTGGRLPEKWSMKANPLWSLDDSEIVTTRKAQAETDKTYIDLGVLTAEEVRASRFTGEWSAETELDEGMEAFMREPPDGEDDQEPADE